MAVIPEIETGGRGGRNAAAGLPAEKRTPLWWWRKRAEWNAEKLTAYFHEHRSLV